MPGDGPQALLRPGGPSVPPQALGTPELELEVPVFKSLLGQRLLWARQVARQPHAGRSAWTLQPTSHRGFKEAAWARCPPPPGRDPFCRPQALTAEDAPLHLDTRSLPQLST